MYHPSSPYVVWCHDCWWSDGWDGTDYATDYDLEKPLLDQFKELQLRVPREALIIINSTNCDYGNHVRSSKDVYFSYLVAGCENGIYSMWINNVKDVIASSKAVESELLAYCIDVSKCFRCAYLQDSSDCSECYFSYDLKGCSNCIFSWNLRNKSWYAFNRQVSKEEFEKIKSEAFAGGWVNHHEQEKRYFEIKKKALRRFAFILKSNNIEGNYLEGTNNAHWCFDGFNVKDVKSVASILNSGRGMYSYSIGVEPVEFFYACSVIKGGTNLKFCFNLANSADCSYCDSLITCSSCTASTGLKKKEYCLLNKQYTKDEYTRILADCERRGELEKHPGAAFSTFAYNETVAHDHYPLEESHARELGYGWQSDFQYTTRKETLSSDKIPDNIKDVTENISKEILSCVLCGRNYRIIPAELQFYKRFNLPLPRKCPQCGFAERRADRQPYRLWLRRCQCLSSESSTKKNGYRNTASHFHGNESCPNEFETSYAPDRKEIIYCESCYQAEII